MPFTVVPVHGEYVRPDGTTPESGEVLFRLNEELMDVSSGQTIGPTYVLATLDGSGEFTVELVATNDPTTTPTGVTYEVTERFSLGPVVTYQLEVDYETVGTMELASAVHVTDLVRSNVVDGGTP